jgi:site-specific recombinase XerD
VFGKGSKERLVPIGRSAIGAVAGYLRELRPRLEKGEGKGILFLNARGRPLTRMGAWKILRGYVERAGITKHVSPHHPAALRSRRTCSREAADLARYRRCLVTWTSRRLRSTLT